MSPNRPGRAIIAGNWKMHKLSLQAAETARELQAYLRAHLPLPPGEILICPPFTAISAVREALGQDPIVGLAAQNVHWSDDGSFTGEVSAGMLRDASCRAVLVGHSERRAVFGETDAQVSAKAQAAIAAGLLPIICVGETLEQRQAGQTADVLRSQVTAAIADLAQVYPQAELVVAYEPVWAIGTGHAAGVADAVAAAATIRAALSPFPAAAKARVLYGGSVKSTNAGLFMAEAAIDGVLVGGASLEAPEFGALVLAGLAAKAK